MATPLEYLWDRARRLFRRKDTAREVPKPVVRQAIDDFGEAAKAELNRLAIRLQVGEINESEFAIKAKASIKSIHIAAASVALGGKDKLTPKDLGYIGSLIKSEYKYFDAMMREVGAESQPLDGTFLARVAMYGAASTKTFEAVTRRANQVSGDFDQDRRRLGKAEHCPECIEYAGKGWQPIGTLPEIGSKCSCKSNCKCYFEYRRSG